MLNPPQLSRQLQCMMSWLLWPRSGLVSDRPLLPMESQLFLCTILQSLQPLLCLIACNSHTNGFLLGIAFKCRTHTTISCLLPFLIVWIQFSHVGCGDISPSGRNRFFKSHLPSIMKLTKFGCRHVCSQVGRLRISQCICYEGKTKPGSFVNFTLILTGADGLKVGQSGQPIRMQGEH